MDAPCPICRKKVSANRADNPHAPFCSGRCKTVDLGRWISGDYAIAARVSTSDEAEQLAAVAGVAFRRGDA